MWLLCKREKAQVEVSGTRAGSKKAEKAPVCCPYLIGRGCSLPPDVPAVSHVTRASKMWNMLSPMIPAPAWDAETGWIQRMHRGEEDTCCRSCCCCCRLHDLTGYPPDGDTILTRRTSHKILQASCSLNVWKKKMAFCKQGWGRGREDDEILITISLKSQLTSHREGRKGGMSLLQFC